MIIESIKKNITEDKVVLSCIVKFEKQEREESLFFSFPKQFADYVTETADAFFPALLIPAMELKERIKIIPPISSKMMKNQFIIQDVFATWFKGKFFHIDIEAANQYTSPQTAPKGNATFFSLGVDSMYSMLKYLPKNQKDADKLLTSLIYMKGLELPLSIYKKGQDKGVIDKIEELARHYQLELIVGETNIRDVFPLDWEEHYFGPGLAATALSLSGGFRNIYIPSSNTYSTLFHDPSSPLLDSLWSNESTFLFHDGSETERAEKLAGLIASDPLALNSLRVCIDNEGRLHNCGKCWKCVRTMITLDIIGKLKECTSFPDKLPKSYSVLLRTFNDDSWEFTSENLRLAQKHNRKDYEKTLRRELRVGRLDMFREGKSMRYLMNELVHYFYVKAARKLGFFS